MKKFITYLLIFFCLPLVIAILFFNTKASLVMNNAKRAYTLVEEVEEEKIETKTLLLGDSVCNQFYGENSNEQVYCLCYNQSFEIPGNYLLLKILLDQGSKFENVVLVINPITLAASLNQQYTNNYFVKPFKSHLDKLEAEDFEYLSQTFPDEFLLKYKFSNFKLENTLDYRLDESIESLDISNRNLKYLEKIKEICRSHNINFKMVSPPLPISGKKQIKKFNSQHIKLFNNYFESIIYYNAEHSNDGIHHSNALRYIESNKTTLEKLIKI